MILKDVVNEYGLSVLAISEEQELARPIVFDGCGWYSLDDDGTYYKGKAPTFSRIYITDVVSEETNP